MRRTEEPVVKAHLSGVRVVQGKPIFFKKAKVENAEAILTRMLLPHKPPKPLTGPVRLEISVAWPWRDSDVSTRATAELAATHRFRPHTGYPDMDNFEKGFIDLLVRLGFIEEDKNIAVKETAKSWSNEPGAWVRISPCSDPWIELQESKQVIK